MHRTVLLCLLLLGLSHAPLQAASSEQWIDAAHLPPTPEAYAQADAVVLLDEETISIDKTGMATETCRKVVRILRNNGRDHASESVSFDSKVDKVDSLKAWLLRPDTKTETLNNSAWAETGTADGATLADDTHVRSVSFSYKAVAGDIFASETKVTRRLREGVLVYIYSGTLPTYQKRLTLTLPPGFSVTQHLRGRNQPEASRGAEGNTWQWVLREQPHRANETWMTPQAKTDAMLILRIDPPAGATNFAPRRLLTWEDASAWSKQLNTPQCDSSPALVAKVKELTANTTDPLARIRALCTYAQGIRYVANNEGLAKGLGYMARKASYVQSVGFGDCKDKVNLLKSMLREVDIKAHLVLVHTKIPELAINEIPSLGFFNHAICAIEVDDTVQLPTVMTVPGLGRVLIFDPTDYYTALGDLPAGIQGAVAHIEDSGGKELLRLPTPPTAHSFRMALSARITLQQGKPIKVSASCEAYGQAASYLRGRKATAHGTKDLDKLAQSLLGDNLHTAELSQRDFDDQPDRNRMIASVEVSARDFLQFAPGGLMVAKLNVFGRTFIPVLPEKTRKLDILLPGLLQEETIVLPIPADLEVVEIPRPSSVDHEYGTYSQSTVFENGEVCLRRRLELRRTEIPAADFAKLKTFLASIARADRSALLLKSKPTGPAQPAPQASTQ